MLLFAAYFLPLFGRVLLNNGNFLVGSSAATSYLENKLYSWTRYSVNHLTLRLEFLGPPKISHNKQPIELPGFRALALLAYLVMTERAQSREHLIELLFDRPDDPRAALRWTIFHLRKSIGRDHIISYRREITFNFDSDYWLDINAFKEGALEQYRGEFLEGLTLQDALQFDFWLLAERARLREMYQTRLEEQLNKAQQSGDATGTLKIANHLLQLDNLREDWYRAAMLAYSQLGDFQSAFELFKHSKHTLKAELGIDPDPLSIALFETIQAQQAEYYKWVKQRPFLPTESPPETKKPDTTADKDTSRIFTHPLARKIVIFEGLPSESFWVKLFKRSMHPFEERTGIKIVYRSNPGDDGSILASTVASGSPPDIVAFTQPGYLAEFAHHGQVVDLGSFLDADYLRQQYTEPLLELATVDGKVIGAWYLLGLKGLIWYPKKVFDAAGYEVPENWDELKSLSERIVADGRTPWCIGIEDGMASGWVGTDWVENILLRTAPPETYDAWVKGELRFNSPEIWRIFELIESIWRKDDFVYGGTANILNTNVCYSGLPLFENPPGAYLNNGSIGSPYVFPEEAVYGVDYDFFHLPPIDPIYGQPHVRDGLICGMFKDRPEVREVMRYLTTGESTKEFVREDNFLSAHRDTPLEWYTSPRGLRYAQIFFGTETFRFKASDLMPSEIAIRFWRGIVEWIAGGDLDKILQEIDDNWPVNE